MVWSHSAQGAQPPYRDQSPLKDRGNINPFWQEMTSLSRQEGMVLPAPKAFGRANPWRAGPECPCPSAILHLGLEGPRLLDVG